MNTKQKDEKSDLQKHVEYIANQIETGEYETESEAGPDAFGYLSDALDIEYIVASDRKTVLGARILVAFGGPNIWINTRTETVEGYWGGEYAEAEYMNDPLGIEDAIEELFNC